MNPLWRIFVRKEPTVEWTACSNYAILDKNKIQLHSLSDETIAAATS